MKALLAAALVAVSVNAWAGIGVVSDTKGSACAIERDKKSLPGAKGAEIESLDTYVTGGCQSNITFKDDTKVKITENSRLLIDDFVFDPKKSDAGRLALKVGMGTVRYASGQIAKNNPQQVNIKTPSATIAVRGTDFNMTVDEAGQSLVILVPSCRDDQKVKEYELEENTCKVGKIEVTTAIGTVTLDKAFEATYVVSATAMPTQPVVLNTIEAKISNLLILSNPPEIQRIVKDNGRARREQGDFEAEQARQIAQRIKDAQKDEKVSILTNTYADGKTGCNPSPSICVRWDKPEGDTQQDRGRGVAWRTNQDHYAEIKTSGYDSNTSLKITHDDNTATTVIGSGDYGGNIVDIKQNTGVLKR